MGNTETESKLESPLSKAWRTFFDVIFDPWVLLSAFFAVVLYTAGRAGNPVNAQIDALLDILMAITTGVLGGRVSNRVSSLTEESVLFARGKVAVRSLKLLLRNTASLEERTRKLSMLPIGSTPELNQRNYEEIIEACRSLQEQAISSIENWTDIVPEADINTQVGQISELKSKLDQKEENIKSLDAELETERERTSVQGSQSATRVAELERELMQARREASTLNAQLFRANSAITSNKPFNFLSGNLRNSNFSTMEDEGLLSDALRGVTTVTLPRRKPGPTESPRVPAPPTPATFTTVAPLPDDE